MNQQTIILVRGVSGSGKTTFANMISDIVISADQFFEKDGEYRFNPKHLGIAHEWCLQQAKAALIENPGKSVCVANTFTQMWEMAPYFDLAKEIGIQVFCIIVENRHNGQNIHGGSG